MRSEEPVRIYGRGGGGVSVWVLKRERGGMGDIRIARRESCRLRSGRGLGGRGG